MEHDDKFALFPACVTASCWRKFCNAGAGVIVIGPVGTATNIVSKAGTPGTATPWPNAVPSADPA